MKIYSPDSETKIQKIKSLNITAISKKSLQEIGEKM